MTMKRLAIVVRDDGYDQLYTPLMFAQLAAMHGVEVDVLFTMWAVRVVTAEGAAAVRMHRKDADEAAFRELVRRQEFPRDIPDFIRRIKQTGKVRIYGCRFAAKLFGVDESKLLPEADGIVDPLWFLNEKAMQADHCQYF